MIVRPTGVIDLIGGPDGAIIGSGDVWADDDDATYAKLHYRYTGYPDCSASAAFPAVDDPATFVDLVIRVASDPANIGVPSINSVFLFDLSFSWVTSHEGGALLFLPSTPTDFTLTYDSADHADILTSLEAGTLGMQILFTTGVTGVFDQYLYVYEATLQLSAFTLPSISGDNGDTRRRFFAA